MGLDFGNKWKKIKIWSTKDTIGIPLDPAEPLPLDLSPNEPWPYTITRSTDGGNTWNPFFEGVVDENTDVNPNFLPGMFTITRLSIANYAPYRIYINDTASESISNVAIINLPDSSKGVSVVFTNIYSPDTTVKFRTFTAEQLAGDDQKKPVKRAKKNKPVLMPNTANVIDEILKQGFAIMAGLPDEHNAAGKILPYLLPGKQSNVFKTFNDKSVTHTQQPRGLDVTVKGKPIMKKQKAVQASKHNNRFLANLLALKINIAASDAGKTPAGFGSLIYLGTENYPSFAYQADWTVDEIANHADDLLTNWAGKPYQTYDEMNDVMEAINEAFADSMPIGAEDTTSWMGGKLVLNGVRALDDTPDFIKVEGLGAPRTIRYLSEFPIAELPFDLGQNYPNPFNPTTTISFSLDDPSMVTLKVFTVLGVEVESLADRVYLDEGQWDFDFDAARLSSGVYLYQLTVEPLVEEGEDGEVPGPAMQVRKMLLLK
jgi:hypothetical protein